MVFSVLSFGLLAIGLKTLEVGTAYAVWTGIGAGRHQPRSASSSSARARRLSRSRRSCSSSRASSGSTSPEAATDRPPGGFAAGRTGASGGVMRGSWNGSPENQLDGFGGVGWWAHD
ncbi:DMT family transporter [Streptosporangium vulgare]|uniref:DMT family transporter n=1 Tax=Streptosporangium vulgare TaxID=46190 RepID=UPI0031DF85EB